MTFTVKNIKQRILKKKNNNNIECRPSRILYVSMQHDKILKISFRTGYTLISRHRDTRYVYDADNSFGSTPRKLHSSLSTINFGLRARHIFHWPTDKNTLTWEQAGEFISRYFCSSRVQIETRVEVWEWNGTRTGCSNTRRQIILKLYENVICVQIEKNNQSRFFFIILLILLMLGLIFQRKKIARLDICKKDWEKSLANLIFDNFYESTYF